MDKTIQDFIDCKRIAIAGVSRSGSKFGNSIYTELKGRGYEMYIVHPEAQEINGQKCYPNIAALAGKVDGVLICLPPQKAEKALREAAQAGIQHIWIQQGANSPVSDATAKELGIHPVSGKCILMYAQPVNSLHGVHRFFAKVFGQL